MGGLKLNSEYFECLGLGFVCPDNDSADRLLSKTSNSSLLILNSQLTHTYDNLGRFSSLRHPGANGKDVYTYNYLANSNLIQSITYPSSIMSSKSYEAHRDLITNGTNASNGTTISSYSIPLRLSGDGGFRTRRNRLG